MHGKTIAVIVAAVLIALGVQNFVIVPAKKAGVSEAPPQKESAYDRVMRTNTLRCAYALYPPFVSKDPNTGKLSGIMPEVMAEFEKASGLKVVWEPEIDYGNIAATLQAGKADVFCTGMAATPKRGLVIASSTPILYSVLAAFVRPDEARFDNNPERLNEPDVRISVNEGDLSEEFARRLFSKAQFVYKGSLGGEDALFLNVATNKADVTLSAPSNLSTFNKNSPGMALRRVEFKRPLISFPGVLGVDIHEQLLLSVINASLHNLIDNDIVDKILRAQLGSEYGDSYFPAKRQND